MYEKSLQIAEKRRDVKDKEEKERHTHLKAEFQRIARRDKKAFLSDQRKEREENRMKMTRDLFKKIRDTKGTFPEKMCSIKDRNCMDLTIELISHASKVMLKILQARLQQYVNHELPDVQAGFRKGRRTRDQIANICWIMEKTREFQKNIYFCFIDYAKAFDCVDHNKLWKILKDGNTRPPDLPLEKPICRSGSNS